MMNEKKVEELNARLIELGSEHEVLLAAGDEVAADLIVMEAELIWDELLERS